MCQFYSCFNSVLLKTFISFISRTIRSGVLGVKIGVVPQWNEKGEKFHCTILQVGTIFKFLFMTLTISPESMKCKIIVWNIHSQWFSNIALNLDVLVHWLWKTLFFFHMQVVDNHVVKYIPPEEFRQHPSYKSKWKGTIGAVVVGALSSDPYSVSCVIELFSLWLALNKLSKRRGLRYGFLPSLRVRKYN